MGRHNSRKDSTRKPIRKRRIPTRRLTNRLLAINLIQNRAGINIGVRSQEFAPGVIDVARGGQVEGLEVYGVSVFVAVLEALGCDEAVRGLGG